MIDCNSSVCVTLNVSVTLQVQVSLEDNTQVRNRVRQDDTVTFSLPEHSRNVHGMLRLQDPRIELILDQFPCPPCSHKHAGRTNDERHSNGT